MIPEHMVDRMILAAWYYAAVQQGAVAVEAWDALIDGCNKNRFPLGCISGEESHAATAYVEFPYYLADRPWISCKLPV